MNDIHQTEAGGLSARPSFRETVLTFGRIGCLSFGGPAGQIALMHRILVDEKKWVDEKSYLGALNFCMLLPGPEAMQLATWVGWRLHGVAGGLVAGLLFVIPGALVMLALSAAYAAFGKVPAIEAVFLGIKAAVLAIVVEALLRVAKRALKGATDWWIAAAAFAAIYLLAVPFPLIVVVAAVFGLTRGKAGSEVAAPRPAPVPMLDTVRTVALWLVVWIAPLAAIVLVFGRNHVLSEISYFFSKLAVVTFGGAYAVLAYMAQDVVQHYGWLAPAEMLDGLGLAETTPGPLILVTQFVGFLAALREGGAPAWGFAVAGAVVTLWATFTPCFLWIFAGAPYLERITAEPRLRSTLAAVAASVVGVILNLSVWFSVHVLFRQVTLFEFWPVRMEVPVATSIDWKVAVLALLSAVMLFVAHRGVLTTLTVAAALGFALSFV